MGFGPENYVKIIHKLVKIEFYYEAEWWNAHFLPGIDMFMHNVVDEENCRDLIAALKTVDSAEIETESYIQKLEARIGYINTKYRLIEDSKFHNMIMNDLNLYREKEILRLQKQNSQNQDPADGDSKIDKTEAVSV